jgi:DNA (cytosine-5)-methyltransferase 1
MTHGSLFSGIGGFDLAAEWMGWNNIFHCEWNEFGKRVLKHYWPNAISYHDITKTDFTIHRGTIDILTGGFPCQPYSTAGKRLGKEDERHLWPEMLRAVREIQPRWIVGENVFGIVNWSGGMVFNEVQADLEAEGYEVQAYVLPAAAVNAPHRRDRVWFVAHSKTYGFSQSARINQRKEHLENNGNQIRTPLDSDGGIGNVAHAECDGKRIKPVSHGISIGQEFINACKVSDAADTNLPGCQGEREQRESATQGKRVVYSGGWWQRFPTQSPICFRNDGLSSRLDGITFPKWRNESIKAGGNAIVPQVALQIFKTIADYEDVK